MHQSKKCQYRLNLLQTKINPKMSNSFKKELKRNKSTFDSNTYPSTHNTLPTNDTWI